MRTFLALCVGLVVLMTGFWAYQENYRTRQTLADLRDVQRQIGALRAELAVLEVEWAYLNRPERLRALADLNFERLNLIPMRPEHFGHVDQIAYPPKLEEPELPGVAGDEMELVTVGFGEPGVIDIRDVVAPEPVPDENDGQFP
ncbi:MAG: cell division protein FtsL [Rhodobacteraceae bacterium]|nr:cell division protein FtsL [Paracoccaceae bacterium]